MIILSILYFFTGLIYLTIELKYILKEKEIKTISLFRGMYAFIYGFLPSIIILRINNGESTISMPVDKNHFIEDLMLSYIFSIIEYSLITVFYNTTASSRRTHNISKEFNYNSSNLRIGITVVLIIGILSLYLWTKEFGGISGFMLHAKSIRSGLYERHNPFAFMKHFTAVIPVCLFISFSLLLKEKREGRIKVYTVILILVSLFFSLVKMLCSDGRGTIGVLVVVLVFCYYIEKIIHKEISVVSTIVRVIGFGILGFALILLSDGVMTYIRYKEEYASTLQGVDIVASIEDEFGYTLINQVIAMESFGNVIVHTYFFNDLIGVLFSWFPSSLIPFEMPTDLWDYNTTNVRELQSGYGQLPTDFVTASFYLFGILGVVLLPAIMGFLLKKLDCYFYAGSNSHYSLAYYSRFLYFSIWWVSHFSFAYTMLSLFGIVLTQLLIMVVNDIIISKVGDRT